MYARDTIYTGGFCDEEYFSDTGRMSWTRHEANAGTIASWWMSMIDFR